MTDFRDILYFYPEKKKQFAKLTFLIKEFRFCLHMKMMSFGVFFLFFFFLHIGNFKVRDFAILDYCPDDKNHK